jgi:hypothetical protein
MLLSGYYEMVLETMLVEIEEQHNSTVSTSQAKDLFFGAMLAWGPISALVERIRLLQWRHVDQLPLFDNISDDEEGQQVFSRTGQLALDLYLRRHQRAMDHSLDNPSFMIDLLSGQVGSNTMTQRQAMIDSAMEYAAEYTLPEGIVVLSHSPDSLFDMVKMASRLVPRMTLMYAAQNSSLDAASSKSGSVGSLLSKKQWSSAQMNIVTEALAELSFMRGEYLDALRLFMILAVNRSGPRLDEKALKLVQGGANANGVGGQNHRPLHNEHEFVLAMIEHHNLFSCLLDQAFLPVIGVNARPKSRNVARETSNEVHAARALSPIVALIHLVGLDFASSFLLEHCVASDGTAEHHGAQNIVVHGAEANLPLQAVAAQLSGRPKLLHWYLHQIFLHRPEVYVDLSHMAVPSKEVLDLHRTHFELHVKYYVKDSALSDQDAPLFATIRSKIVESPLMAFLRVSLRCFCCALSQSANHHLTPRHQRTLFLLLLDGHAFWRSEAPICQKVHRTASKRRLCGSCRN